MKSHIVQNAKILFFTCLSFCLLFPLTATAATDVTDLVEIQKSRLRYDRRTGISSTDISIQNISQEILLTPIKLVITSISNSDVSIANADGFTDNGLPYFEYANDVGELKSSDTLPAKQWKFSNPDRARFSYIISAQGEVTVQDSDGDGMPDDQDGCPNDSDKTKPGSCGCGLSDTDSDNDGTPDCNDQCPEDPKKTSPGICGCGVADMDGDGDGVPDCNDNCPNDPNQTEPGICGCGVADTDSDSDGTVDCLDNCPNDPAKTNPGTCGCGVEDSDTDGDGTPDCNDGCIDDPSKTDPGVCGCSVPDTDSDNDDVPDCEDNCPDDPDKIEPGTCGCGVADVDSDTDGVMDCNDNCPNTPNGESVNTDGCSASQMDSDNDGVVDSEDLCPDSVAGETVDQDGCSSQLPVENIIPVAVAGVDQSVYVGETVELNGSGSYDRDNTNNLSYTWELTKPEGSSSTILNVNGKRTKFVPDIQGSYTVSLSVDDGLDHSTDTAIILAYQKGSIDGYIEDIVMSKPYAIVEKEEAIGITLKINSLLDRNVSSIALYEEDDSGNYNTFIANFEKATNESLSGIHYTTIINIYDEFYERHKYKIFIYNDNGELVEDSDPFEIRSTDAPFYNEHDNDYLVYDSWLKAWKIKNRIRVKFAPSVDEFTVKYIIANEMNAVISSYSPTLNLYTFEIPNMEDSYELYDNMAATLDFYQHLNIIEYEYISECFYVDINLNNNTLSTTNDYEYYRESSKDSLHYHAFNDIKAQEGWGVLERIYNEAGCNMFYHVNIGIIDPTGVDAEHPELKDVKFSESTPSEAKEAIPIVSSKPECSSDGAHGTNIAGIIAARNDRSLSSSVPSPETQMNGLLTGPLDKDGNPLIDFSLGVQIGKSLDEIITSMETLINNHHHIINMSLGFIHKSLIESACQKGYCHNCSSGLSEEVFNTYKKEFQSFFKEHEGTLFIVSAGNLPGPANQQIPAGIRADNVITVSAHDADFAAEMPGIDISAPAYVYTTNPPQGYTIAKGTSFSAPLVTAAAAIIKSIDPAQSPKEIKKIILDNYNDIGNEISNNGCFIKNNELICLDIGNKKLDIEKIANYLRSSLRIDNKVMSLEFSFDEFEITKPYPGSDFELAVSDLVESHNVTIVGSDHDKNSGGSDTIYQYLSMFPPMSGNTIGSRWDYGFSDGRQFGQPAILAPKHDSETNNAEPWTTVSINVAGCGKIPVRAYTIDVSYPWKSYFAIKGRITPDLCVKFDASPCEESPEFCGCAPDHSNNNYPPVRLIDEVIVEAGDCHDDQGNVLKGKDYHFVKLRSSAELGPIYFITIGEGGGGQFAFEDFTATRCKGALKN